MDRENSGALISEKSPEKRMAILQSAFQAERSGWLPIFILFGLLFLAGEILRCEGAHPPQEVPKAVWTK